MSRHRPQYLILAVVLATLGGQVYAKDKPGPKSPTAKGFIGEFPADRVYVDCGRRNPFFFVGEAMSFSLKGPPADRFEVRDYWGAVVDKGAADGKSVSLKSQPPGWYKLYIFGKPMVEPKMDTRTDQEQELAGDTNKAKKEKQAAALAAWKYRQNFGDAVGGTMFVIARDNPNFPKLPPLDSKYPKAGNGDEVMRAVSGMGPQRHSADASKPDESIKNLEAEIATDRELYLPFDPARKRALMIAFPGGTRGHLDGVKQIVEHFKNDVKYYEPRNEPNGGSNGTDFVKNEMADFYKAVKSVDPSLKVMGPGTVTAGPFGAGLVFIEDFLKAGGADYIDAFSFHCYNNVNGDLWLVHQTMGNLTALLKKYNADKKELWQTEQGYFACVYGAYQPHLQARWTMLEMMVFEQFGLPKEHNHLWYDRSHGFWDFPTWWENDDGGFNPALPLMRVYSEEVFGKNFASAYDLGPIGNKLYLGSLFHGSRDVAVFMSAGSTDGKVELKVSGGAPKLHLVSAFGVESDLPVADGSVTLPVPELPVYVDLAEGQKIEVIPQDFGENLARGEGVKLTSSGSGVHPVNPKIPNDISKLNNGILEDWYYQQHKTEAATDQPWMDDTAEFPAWVEIRFPKPTQLSRMIMYAAAPWQWQGTPTDYELQYDADGKWVTIEHVNEPLKTFKVLTPCTRTKVDSFFSDRHIFQHQFPAVTTNKLRLLVHNTTFGGGATADVDWAGGQTGPHHLMLREIEVYAK